MKQPIMYDGLTREVEKFLYREARLLGERRLHEWLELFSEAAATSWAAGNRIVWFQSKLHRAAGAPPSGGLSCCISLRRDTGLSTQILGEVFTRFHTFSHAIGGDQCHIRSARSAQLFVSDPQTRAPDNDASH
jgi:hypothetical protein